MKKFVSTILILFYVFASIGFGSIHYYCNMSFDNPVKMDMPGCACSTSGMDHVTETTSCCDTDNSNSNAHDHSAQSDQSQFVMDCCSIEINYHQADDVTLKMNESQNLIHSDNMSNLIIPLQIDNYNISDKTTTPTIPTHRNLPLLI